MPWAKNDDEEDEDDDDGKGILLYADCADDVVVAVGNSLFRFWNFSRLILCANVCVYMRERERVYIFVGLVNHEAFKCLLGNVSF